MKPPIPFSPTVYQRVEVEEVNASKPEHGKEEEVEVSAYPGKEQESVVQALPEFSLNTGNANATGESSVYVSNYKRLLPVYKNNASSKIVSGITG